MPRARSLRSPPTCAAATRRSASPTAGSSQWPRTLLGLGSLVAAAGTDPATTPASASYSTVALTLNETWSKAANAAGGTLTQAAEVVAQQFRNRVATLLKVTPTNNSVISGATTSDGLMKTGAGTLLFGSTSNSFVGAVTINGGALHLDHSGPFPGTNGGTVNLGSGGLTITGTINSGVGTVLNGGTLQLGGGQITGGLTTTSGGTLVLSGNQFNGGTVGVGTLTGGGVNTITLTNPISTIFNPVIGTGLTIGNTGYTGVIDVNNATFTGSGATLTLNAGSDLVLSRGLTNISSYPNFTFSPPTGATLLNSGSINVVSGTTNITNVTTNPGLGNVTVTQPLGSFTALTGANLQATTTAAVPADQ